MSVLLKTRRRLLAALVATADTLVIASAAAEEPRAEQLFREGRALMLEGRFDEACPMLAESQKLDPHIGTLLNLAVCHERQGKVGSAWVEYQNGLTAARAEGQADRIRFAEERIAVVEPRVPWLRIHAPEGLAIELDGAGLSHASLGQELPVDPGLHVVRAERFGATVFGERVELREGEHRGVNVVLASTETPPVPSPPTPTPTPEEKPRKSRWVVEAGLFMGYAGGKLPNPSPRSSDNTPVYVEGEQRGFAAGLNLFGGYGVTDRIVIGGHLMAGPMTAGASVVAGGPSIALNLTEAITLGTWVAFGNVTFKGYSTHTNPEYGTFVEGQGEIGLGAGGGLQLAVRLFGLGPGAVVATSTPFVLASNTGHAFFVPASLTYRFH